MKTLSAEQDAWVSRLATRLRTLQAAHAEDGPGSRLPVLREEIILALPQLPAAQRADALDALAECFPVWQAGDASGTVRADAETIDMPHLPPEELVARLLAAAPLINADNRRHFAQLLANAGLVFPPKAPPFELPAEVRAQLGLSSSQTVDAARSLRLFAMLVDIVTSLDQVSWTLWRNIAPHSTIRREAFADSDFRRIAARYLRGENEASGQQVGLLLDKTRQLIAGMLSAIVPAGETFSRNYLSRFGPEAIEAETVGGMLGGFFVGSEQRCWRKYVELFNQTSGASVEREIVNSVVQSAEATMFSGKRGAT